MKRLILGVLLGLVAPIVAAQEATLNTPVARTAEAKYIMKRLDISADQAIFEVWVRDSNNENIRQVNFVVPDVSHPGADIPGVFTAIATPRATETGGVLRRANFRLLGFLFDNGYLPGVSLVP